MCKNLFDPNTWAGKERPSQLLLLKIFDYCLRGLHTNKQFANSPGYLSVRSPQGAHGKEGHKRLPVKKKNKNKQWIIV